MNDLNISDKANPSPEAIKALMVRYNLKLKDCAPLLGVAKSTFEAWMYNRTKMPYPMWLLFRILVKFPNIQEVLENDCVIIVNRDDFVN